MIKNNMNIQFIGQGLSNESPSAGSILIDSFQDLSFNKFSVFVAFVGVAGIRQLEPHIQNSKEHILDWTGFFGVDQKGTSKEALEALLALDINSKIYFTTTTITYHPKVYLFEGVLKNRILIGSSNLTEKGLFNNIEANIVIDVDKEDILGLNLIEEIKLYFNDFLTGENNNTQVLTSNLINQLHLAGIVPTELERGRIHDNINRTISDSNLNNTIIHELFPSISIQRTPQRINAPNRSHRETQINNLLPSDLWSIKGELGWIKPSLSRSDAQIIESERTNVTGVLRLTFSRYEYNGSPIDKNTYFRFDLFGGADWNERERPNKSPLEETNMRFLLMIDGENKGEFNLRVSHDVDRIADQANVPTYLHWGEAISIIRSQNLQGKSLFLYKPPVGMSEPFFIVIEDENDDVN